MADIAADTVLNTILSLRFEWQGEFAIHLQSKQCLQGVTPRRSMCFCINFYGGSFYSLPWWQSFHHANANTMSNLPTRSITLQDWATLSAVVWGTAWASSNYPSWPEPPCRKRWGTILRNWTVYQAPMGQIPLPGKTVQSILAFSPSLKGKLINWIRENQNRNLITLSTCSQACKVNQQAI